MNSIGKQLVKLSRPSGSIIFMQSKSPQCLQIVANSSNSAKHLKLKYQASVFLMTARILYKKISDAISGKKPRAAKVYPKDTVVLHQFPRGLNTPSMSPYALKLETWCRAANVNYQNQFGMERGSNGLIPFIKLNDYVVEDSQRCIEYLTDILEKDLNSHLTEEQKVISRLVIKLTDDSLKWSMAMFRFIHNPNGIKDNGFPRIAYWNFGYRVEKAAKYAGYGTLTIEQLFLNAKKDLDAVDFLVGDKKFLFSDEKPSDADFAVFGLVAQFLWNDTGIVHNYLKADCQNLVRHSENIKATYWKDWNNHLLRVKDNSTKKL